MKYKLLLSFALLSIPLSSANAEQMNMVSDADRAFVEKVSQGGMFEVMAGELATEQGSSPDIKDQGATEVHDHQQVNDELKTLAEVAGISISDTLNSSFQKDLDDLKALSGRDFEVTYLKMMESLHDKDGAAFAKEAKLGENPDLRKFAAETHLIVERHIGELRAVGPEKK